MLNKKIIMKSIQDNLDEVKGYGIRRIGVFGSFVRSSGNEKSDIDVLVEFFLVRRALTIIWN